MDSYSKPLTLADAAEPSPNDGPQVHFMTWGIFTVACDDQGTCVFPFLSGAWRHDYDLSIYKQPVLAFMRLLTDLWRIAPWNCLEYYFYTSWMIISPAISSYLGYLVLHNVDSAVKNLELKDEILQKIQKFAFMWLICGIITHHALTMLQYESRVKLGPHLRSYFLPKLAKEILRRNLDELKDDFAYFPSSYDYGDFIPGWDSFHATFTRLRHTLAIVVEILLILCLKFQEDDPHCHILVLMLIIFFAIMFLSPIDAVGGKGYTFWTKDNNYNRLMALFNMVFDLRYRQTLLKDGQIENLYNEYESVSDALGTVKADTYMLGWCLYPSWTWGIIKFCITNSPMALIALSLPWLSSTSPVVLMAIIQYAIFILEHNIEYLRNSSDSFLGSMTKVMKFYGLFDRAEEAEVISTIVDRSTDPEEETRSSTGVEIVFRNVAYESIENVDLDIRPGQLILITGGNDSGKTSLIKLLSGVMSPTQGDVLINGQTMCRRNAKALLNRTVYVSSSDVIYPITLGQNIVMAVPNHELATGTDVDEALRLGGAYDLVESLNRETVLTPCSAPGYSIGRDIGPGAIKALKQNCPDPTPVNISEGQRQHIIASRAFLRLKICDIDLIILDEASNAMDPIEGREVTNNFRQIARDQGKTMIVVATRNLFNIATQADMIIYMEKGKIVERGLHEELINLAGGYAELYKAGNE